MNGKEAIKQAKISLNQANYLSECGRNAGIRAMYNKKAEWLSVLIYLAEKALAERNGENEQKRCFK